ncbi:MAG: LysR family transcriptional regulator, partial [Betaproteobacteria bacterium]|nr:LysR family transcriptional regulator [Betaproteobacteria bacterium]
LASGSLYEWELDEQARRVAVQTRGSAIVTDATAARELALAGVGVAYLFEPLVREDLRQGRLLRLLPRASLRHDGLFLYFPRRASMSAKLRALIDAAAQGMA